MKIQYKKVESLLLDPNNSRFAELYDGSDKEEDLIEYLLYTEAAEEVAKNISDRKQFYPDKALWVMRDKGKFIVKDGNRRCAAVKALNNPQKFGLKLPKMQNTEVPVLVYDDINELNRRIKEQHTNNFFREWDRIAKALKAHEMHNTGSSLDSIKEMDTNPPQLIKLASFYYEAVEIAGEDLKRLLRRGRGQGGGRTIIFERLFTYSGYCGYNFRGKPSYKVEITDYQIFNSYVSALVDYLNNNPNTTYKDVDSEKYNFLKRLKGYGFAPSQKKIKTSTPPKSTTNTPNKSTESKRGSAKTRPSIQRKQVSSQIKSIIKECYALDSTNFPNSKIAISRVVFESVLKYVVTETKYKGKYVKNFKHFELAFYDKKSNQLKYTNFKQLRFKFIELINDTGIKNAFKQFDLEYLHQIIHNYKVRSGPGDATSTVNNLMPLLEFMLQDENDLLNALDTKKLV